MMNKAMVSKAAMAALTMLTFSPLALAAKKPQGPQQAENIRTLFVEKGSAEKLVSVLNVLHARMEAEGWTYQDMGVYIEDGDLEGIFVTYLKLPPPTPPVSLLAPPDPVKSVAPAPAPTPATAPMLTVPAPAAEIGPPVSPDPAAPAELAPVDSAVDPVPATAPESAPAG